jgi:predicted transcriptional regulator
MQPCQKCEIYDFQIKECKNRRFKLICQLIENNWTVAEIAHELEMPYTTVYSQVKKLRKITKT